MCSRGGPRSGVGGFSREAGDSPTGILLMNGLPLAMVTCCALDSFEAHLHSVSHPPPSSEPKSWALRDIGALVLPGTFPDPVGQTRWSLPAT